MRRVVGLLALLVCGGGTAVSVGIDVASGATARGSVRATQESSVTTSNELAVVPQVLPNATRLRGGRLAIELWGLVVL